jgi:hypothetical protein
MKFQPKEVLGFKKFEMLKYDAFGIVNWIDYPIYSHSVVWDMKLQVLHEPLGKYKPEELEFQISEIFTVNKNSARKWYKENKSCL